MNSIVLESGSLPATQSVSTLIATPSSSAIGSAQGMRFNSQPAQLLSSLVGGGSGPSGGSSQAPLPAIGWRRPKANR